jgi:hypothetical protein
MIESPVKTASNSVFGKNTKIAPSNFMKQLSKDKHTVNLSLNYKAIVPLTRENGPS